MEFVEILVILIVASSTGYQAEKAGAKQEAIQNGGYCIPNTLETQACYKVNEVRDEKVATSMKRKCI